MNPFNHPDGQQDQGNEEVLHEQGEDYQQLITFRSGSKQAPTVLGLDIVERQI